jgi:hypothetical protein
MAGDLSSLNLTDAAGADAGRRRRAATEATTAMAAQGGRSVHRWRMQCGLGTLVKIIDLGCARGNFRSPSSSTSDPARGWFVKCRANRRRPRGGQATSSVMGSNIAQTRDDAGSELMRAAPRGFG